MKRFLLSFFLLGCSSSPFGNEYHVVVDPSFTEQHQKDIAFALSRWEMAETQFNLWLPMRVGTIADNSEPNTFTVHPSTLSQLDNQYGEPYAGATFRQGNCDCGTVQIATDVADINEWHTMLAHEFGHMVGLAHSPKWNIMYPGWDASVPRFIMCNDVEQFAQVRNNDRVVFCDGPISVYPDKTTP